MIVAITEQFHDYKPRHYLVDSDKLVPQQPIDAQLLEAIALPGKTATVEVDGTQHVEAAISLCAVLENGSGNIEKNINLNIKFGDGDRNERNSSV